MKTFFGILVSIIFIPIFIILIFYLSITNSVVNENYVPQRLSKTNTYTTLSEKVIPTFLENLKNTQAPVDQQQAFDSTIKKIRQTITPKWLDNLASNSYKYIVQYIKDDIQKEKMNIDLNALSSILSKEELIQSFVSSDELKVQFENLPICNNTQKDNCRPEDLTYEKYQEMLFTNLTDSEEIDINFEIPETINLYDLINSNNYILDNVKNIYAISQTISKLVILFLLFLILLWIIIFSNQPDRIVKYIAHNLLIVAIFMAIISALPIFSSSFINTLIPHDAIPYDIIYAISDIIKNIFHKILSISIIIAIISIALIFVYKNNYLSKLIQNIKTNKKISS